MIFPNTAIIIVNYNQINHTLECIQSLLKAGADLSQTIVVDNNSRDGSVEILRQTFGDALTLYDLPENRGYPYALNQGIPVALEKGFEWLLLMNNDVIVDKEFLNALRIATEENEAARLFAPAILYYDSPELIWNIGYVNIPGTLIGIRSYRGHKYSESLPKYLKIDVLHGCTMMVHKSVFETIGLFDDSNLIYGDDADFSIRAYRANFEMIAATRAKMWHKISLTMGKEKPYTRFLRTRNTIAFYNKYTKGFQKFLMFSFSLAKAVVTIMKDIFRGHSFLVKPYLYGIYDGWTNSKKDRNF